MDVSESRTEREKKSLAEIYDFFLEYHKQKQAAMGIISEEDMNEPMPCEDIEDGDDDDDDDDDEYKTKEKDLPKHIVAVKEVCSLF